MSTVSQQRLRAEFLRLKKQALRVKLYQHPELYDLAYPGPVGDVAFYRRHARPGAVLYLGVGTGRVFAEIATRNPRLMGLDYSRPMLAAIKTRHPGLRTRLREGSVLDRGLYEVASFDRILAPHSFFTQFAESALTQALGNCRRWLKPTGQLVTDNFSPFWNPPPSKPLELYRRRHGQNFAVATYIEYDPLGQESREWNFFRRRAHRQLLVAPITLRYYYPAEFARILRAAGFEQVKLQGGFAGAPLSLQSRELIYIARA
ncbi:MAG: class I SAM-dependent methyltransferase [Pirellulales bacterium]